MKRKIKKNIRKVAKKGKKLLAKAWKDPLTQEFVRGQKKLARSTLKKAIKRARKKVKL